MRQLLAQVERFPTRRPFVIARATKTHVDVVTVTLRDGPHAGRGEGTPIDYRGEDCASALAAIEAVRGEVEAGAGRADLLDLLGPGAARNALDAALWDLEAKASGVAVWQRIGLPPPRPLLTAFTISLGEPAAMAEAARAVAGRELLKLKLGGEGDLDRVRAVRQAAPAARLIADANQSWAGLDVEALCHGLHALGVELVEQPLPAGQDAELAHVRSPVPLAADESVHDCASLDAIVGRYRMVNVKLDKAGGLTEGLALIHAAQQRGLGVMVGCMLSTSLGIAPAFLAAMHASHADLDGPLLLAEDRAHPLAFSGSDVHPPDRALWG
ncbi:MAG: N-acetyl-D-Glu racemase DgcA [Thermaurantiacus tibetensis]|uniref:N-acetyl-D-Glu racemase DgcA n=1 Tax=Thermaurantiacus tibetensis TaxID=2759035 RepID=UPI00188F5EEB|nr:N-acetyl-D-Glu racemase DgcA [Thermaurantiacus tibetensis]